MWAAYASELWHELFVGVAGAAALTGSRSWGWCPGSRRWPWVWSCWAWVWASGCSRPGCTRCGGRPVDPFRAPVVVGVVTSQLATLPVIVAGASLVAQRGGGLYWLVPAIVLLLGVGVMNAWVLLVEILR